ncbi:MAG: PilN domain-containing protein [Candidatus Omnitrophica bacterium]|nr:PilN domain-containing protein [Candidatus Omnitrophota bacterium]
MIEINLLPEELRKKEARFVFPAIASKKVLIRGLLVFFGVQLLLFLWVFAARLELVRVKAQTNALNRSLGEITRLKTDIAVTEGRLKDFRKVTARPFYWTTVLNAISDSVTKGIWLKSLALEAGAQNTRILKLQGSVIGPGQETAYVGKFIKELKDNPALAPLFVSVELSTMSQRKISNYDVYDFTVVCMFQKEKI